MDQTQDHNPAVPFPPAALFAPYMEDVVTAIKSFTSSTSFAGLHRIRVTGAAMFRTCRGIFFLWCREKNPAIDVERLTGE